MSSDSEVESNSLFKCDVCLIDYGQSRQQKFLPCLHSFCQSCLTEIQQADGAIKCPICRELHVNSRDVSSLPNNYFEALKKMEREKNEIIVGYAEVVKKQTACIRELDHFVLHYRETIEKLKQLKVHTNWTKRTKLMEELHDLHSEKNVLLMSIISDKVKVIRQLKKQVAILEKAQN